MTDELQKRIASLFSMLSAKDVLLVYSGQIEILADSLCADSSNEFDRLKALNQVYWWLCDNRGLHMKKLISHESVSSKKKQTLYIETDLHRLAQRQKQIEAVKKKDVYQCYITELPKSKRIYSLRYTGHPRTPDIYVSRSNRSFKGVINEWNRLLHRWNDDRDALAKWREKAKLTIQTTKCHHKVKRFTAQTAANQNTPIFRSEPVEL